MSPLLIANALRWSALSRSRRATTGQSRIVANFLLAWWDAAECGGSDLTDVWAVDTAIAVDILQVFVLVAMSQREIWPRRPQDQARLSE